MTRKKGGNFKNKNNNNNNSNKNSNISGAPNQQSASKKQKYEEEERIIQTLNFTWDPRADDAFLTESESEFIENWTTKLSSTVPPQYSDIIRKELTTAVFQSFTLSNKQKITDLYNFFNAHPNVSVIKEEWPSDITNDEILGFGFKIKDNRSRFGGDDAVYQRNPLLQLYLPRGVVMIKSKDGYDLVLFSNRKFYGRKAGDDDDCLLTSSSLESGIFSSFLVSEKANGESAQLAYIGNNRWVIGSKNRKILVKEPSDVNHYRNLPCYGFAHEIADSFFEYLRQMGEEKATELKNLLTITKWTVNFEFESPSHQHIVPLFERKLVLIGCTGIHVPSGKSSHPIVGASIARYFGFPSVLKNTDVYKKSELDSVCSKICREWNSEGSVLILLNESSNVVDFVKVKAWWYVLLRAIREKIRSIQSINQLPQIYNRIHKRLLELQRDMDISSDYINQFSKLGVGFADYIFHNHLAKGKEKNIVMESYPVLWIEYLTNNQLPIDHSLIQQNVNVNIENINEIVSDLPLLLIPQGVPGLGKSLLAQRICDLFNASGVKAIQVAQDDFAQKKNSGQACFEHISALLHSREYKLVILARNNSTLYQYQKYLNLELDNACKIVFFHCKELQTRTKEALMMCIASVLHRKMKNENHPTTSLEIGELASLPLKFMGDYKANTSGFSVASMNDNVKVNIPAKFDEIASRFFAKGFKADSLRANEVNDLHLNDPNYIQQLMTLHRPVDEIARDCFNEINQIVSSYVPPTASFYSCSFSKVKTTELLNSIQAMLDYEFPNDWALFADHVTLIHANDYLNNREFWHRVAKYDSQEVSIVPESLLFIEGKCCVLSVSLQFESGESANDLVLSKMPHITIATAPKIKTFQSSDFLATHSDILIPISASFGPFKSHVVLTSNNENVESSSENVDK